MQASAAARLLRAGAALDADAPLQSASVGGDAAAEVCFGHIAP